MTDTIGFIPPPESVFNLSRKTVRLWNVPLDPSKVVWISISEPDDPESSARNMFLERLPRLRLSFFDVLYPVEHNGKMLHPPTEADAAKIVDFIVKHKGKAVLVNCAAGVSRSGAVARFCNQILGYKWSAPWSSIAKPNIELFTLMVRHYFRKYEGLF